MLWILLAAVFLPVTLLAVSQLRGGRLGNRYNQGGTSILEADKRGRPWSS